MCVCVCVRMLMCINGCMYVCGARSWLRICGYMSVNTYISLSVPLCDRVYMYACVCLRIRSSRLNVIYAKLEKVMGSRSHDLCLYDITRSWSYMYTYKQVNCISNL